MLLLTVKVILESIVRIGKVICRKIILYDVLITDVDEVKVSIEANGMLAMLEGTVIQSLRKKWEYGRNVVRKWHGTGGGGK